MIQSITFCQFCDAFRDAGRADNFTYEGKKVLFEYLEMLEDDCDTSIELDVIALCCDFSEYDEEELQNDYGLDNPFDNMSEEIKERVIGHTKNTVVLHSY